MPPQIIVELSRTLVSRVGQSGFSLELGLSASDPTLLPPPVEVDKCPQTLVRNIALGNKSKDNSGCEAVFL